MSLPWVRLDTNIATHDKVLRLIGSNHRLGLEAAAVYMFSMAWSGGQATDGHVPKAALPFIHGTPRLAKLLVDVELWDEDERGDGWWVHNFAGRQALAEIQKMRDLGRLGAKARWPPNPSATP